MNYGGFPDYLLRGRHSAGHCGAVTEEPASGLSAKSGGETALRKNLHSAAESDPGQKPMGGSR